MEEDLKLAYTPQLEKAACEWIGKCLKKDVLGYESLGNGIDILNLLSGLWAEYNARDSQNFDLKKIWTLGAKNKEDDTNTFRWKNLNLLEESLGSCWELVLDR